MKLIKENPCPASDIGVVAGHVHSLRADRFRFERRQQPAIAEDGSYTSKDEVALYIHTYGHLPENYITKDEAYDLGWKSEGHTRRGAPGMSIGGDYYGNYEGVLPDEPGREYHECDIDYESGNRNGKRIVYSNDGNIYYTEDTTTALNICTEMMNDAGDHH